MAVNLVANYERPQAERLLALLKQHGVYPYTDLGRDSVPLG